MKHQGLEKKRHKREYKKRETKEETPPPKRLQTSMKIALQGREGSRRESLLTFIGLSFKLNSREHQVSTADA